jgi:hypothetical protein
MWSLSSNFVVPTRWNDGLPCKTFEDCSAENAPKKYNLTKLEYLVTHMGLLMCLLVTPY